MDYGDLWHGYIIFFSFCMANWWLMCWWFTCSCILPFSFHFLDPVFLRGICFLVATEDDEMHTRNSYTYHWHFFFRRSDAYQLLYRHPDIIPVWFQQYALSCLTNPACLDLSVLFCDSQLSSGPVMIKINILGWIRTGKSCVFAPGRRGAWSGRSLWSLHYVLLLLHYICIIFHWICW